MSEVRRSSGANTLAEMGTLAQSAWERKEYPLRTLVSTPPPFHKAQRPACLHGIDGMRLPLIVFSCLTPYMHRMAIVGMMFRRKPPE